MKLTFRVTLLTILLSLLTITVVELGLTAYRNHKSTAADLSVKMLRQTARLIDREIKDECLDARNQLDLNARLLREGRLNAEDFSTLAASWRETLAVFAGFSSFELGLEGS